jgi:hypothetical protein
MCTFTSRRTPLIPSGSRTSSCPVDDEFLRQDVQNLLVVRNRDRLCGFDHAIDVGLRDLLLLDRHHAAGIETADVTAGNSGVDLGDAAVGHHFDFLQHPLDRGHRRFDVDDHATPQATGRLRSKADDAERAFGQHFGDDRHDLRRADVEAHNQILVFPYHPFVTFMGACNRAVSPSSSVVVP